MRILTVPTITSYGDDAVLKRRIPETDFECQLLKAAIAQKGGFFANRRLYESDLTASVKPGDGWDSTGRLCCHLIINDPLIGEDIASFLDEGRGGTFPIYYWVAEREGAASAFYSLVVGWECPGNPFTGGFDQSNHCPYHPVLSAVLGNLRENDHE